MRFVYLFIAVGLVAAALVVTWEGGSSSPQVEAVVPATEPPRYALTGVEWLRLVADGEPEFRADAKTLDYFADGSVVMRTVRLDALGGFSSPWHVEAPRGNAPPHERRLRLTGGVRAQGQVSSENVSLVTPRLWVDLLRRELTTDAQVEMQSDFRNVKARGLRTDFDGEHVQLLKDVRVDYAPPG